MVGHPMLVRYRPGPQSSPEGQLAELAAFAPDQVLIANNLDKG
ncbi:hypothetical protein AB0M46_33690 [Dactylosporangium sp. NPDC051485]